MAVLEGLETLILRSPDSTEDPNVLAIREAKRYLKLLGGETLMNSVQACLSPPRSYTYRDLVRLIKSNFFETVTELHNKKLKIRHVAKNSPLSPPPTLRMTPPPPPHV